MDDINILVHEDMGDVVERFYGFTLRQWITGVLIGVICVPLYIYGQEVINEEIISYICILIAVPIAFVGLVPVQGLKAEKILPFLWRNYMVFTRPLEYGDGQITTNKKAKKKKAKSSKKEDNFTASSKSVSNYFDIVITPETIRMENTISCLIRIPDSNGQYMYLQKAKMARMGKDLLLYRMTDTENIFTYDKEGNNIGEISFMDLKEKFDKFL